MNILKFTRNPRIPLTIRKKAGAFARPRPGMAFRVNMFGLSYEGCTGNHMDDKIYLYGLHEPATVRLMRSILARQRAEGLVPVLMDIGTNAGQHLLAAAPMADRAFGFEPWEPVRSKALRNIAANNLSHVTLFPFGLSDQNARLAFTPPETNNLGTGSFSHEGTLMLDVKRGDDIAREHNIAPTLLKIDVENHEGSVLAGLRETLRHIRPAVIFECGESFRQSLDRPEERDAVFGPGYRFYGIRRSRENPAIVPLKPEQRFENILALPDPVLQKQTSIN